MRVSQQTAAAVGIIIQLERRTFIQLLHLRKRSWLAEDARNSVEDGVESPSSSKSDRVVIAPESLNVVNTACSLCV